MAHAVFDNGTFTWNAVALSSHVRAARLRITPRFVEDSNTMGVTGNKFLHVMGDYTLEVDFSQDFAATQVDVTLAADAEAGTARAWALKFDSGAISATNPEYQGTGFLAEYEPISGAFGEVLGTRCRIIPSVAGVTRDVTP